MSSNSLESYQSDLTGITSKLLNRSGVRRLTDLFGPVSGMILGRDLESSGRSNLATAAVSSTVDQRSPQLRHIRRRKVSRRLAIDRITRPLTDWHFGHSITRLPAVLARPASEPLSEVTRYPCLPHPPKSSVSLHAHVLEAIARPICGP